MSDLNFSYNWNKKLDCDCFTTIRMENANKYRVGLRYKLWLKDACKGDATLLEQKPFFLKDLNEFMARIDTGYSAAETTQIIHRMYPKVDFAVKRLSFILLQKVPAK